MSKMLEATCVAGVVKVGAVPVPSAVIQSEGIGASSGVLLLDEDKARYIAKTSPDLKSALESIASSLGTIASTFGTVSGQLLLLGANPLSLVPITTGIAAITAVQTELTTLKEALK